MANGNGNGNGDNGTVRFLIEQLRSTAEHNTDVLNKLDLITGSLDNISEEIKDVQISLNNCEDTRNKMTSIVDSITEGKIVKDKYWFAIKFSFIFTSIFFPIMFSFVFVLIKLSIKYPVLTSLIETVFKIKVGGSP